MEKEYPKTGEFYQYENGELFQIITIAKHTETQERLVVFQALYPDFQIFARPLSLFLKCAKKQDASNLKKCKQQNMTVKENQTISPKYEKETSKQSLSDAQEEQSEISDETTQAMSGVNPVLLEFLDARTIHDKVKIVREGKKQIDDKCINDLAAALDLAIDEGDLEQRYFQLINCLETMKRFEVFRR